MQRIGFRSDTDTTEWTSNPHPSTASSFLTPPHSGPREVSNQTMMLFLVCARKFVLHDKLVKAGEWTRQLPAPNGTHLRRDLRHSRTRQHRTRRRTQSAGIRPQRDRVRPLPIILGRQRVRRRDCANTQRSCRAIRLRIAARLP